MGHSTRNHLALFSLLSHSCSSEKKKTTKMMKAEEQKPHKNLKSHTRPTNKTYKPHAVLHVQTFVSRMCLRVLYTIFLFLWPHASYAPYDVCLYLFFFYIQSSFVKFIGMRARLRYVRLCHIYNKTCENCFFRLTTLGFMKPVKWNITHPTHE